MMRCTKLKPDLKRGSSKIKIVETETFSIDERISIISGIIAIVRKRKGRIHEE